MRHHLSGAAALLALFLALSAAVEAAGVPLLTDPSGRLAADGAVAAVPGVGLLAAHVVLPVPSSAVVMAHGALFGVVVCTVMSLAGSVAAALVGFGLGGRGRGLLDRLVPVAGRRRSDAVLGRWGVLAVVVVTRPVPLLAETTAVLAGATPSMSLDR